VDDPAIGASSAREVDELRRLVEKSERELASTVARLSEVELAIDGMAAREGSLRELIVDAQDQLIKREQQLIEARAQRDAFEHEARELRVRLERIYSLKPFALYRSVRGLPVLRRLEARRISALEDALRRSAD